MRSENKVFLQWPQGPKYRFWPSHQHVLHYVDNEVGQSQWRFYNLGAFAQLDCNVLIAHRPPPFAYELEKMSMQDIQVNVMRVLNKMFSNKDAIISKHRSLSASIGDRSESSHPIPSNTGEVAQDSDELLVSESSTDEDRSTQRAAERVRAIQRKRREKARSLSSPIDTAWLSVPVTEPARVEVTKW